MSSVRCRISLFDTSVGALLVCNNRISGFGQHLSNTNRAEHDLLPEELKRWMDDYVPFAHVAAKEHWLNIAISVIAKTLTDRATAYFYFGLSDDGPINAAGNIARQLKRPFVAKVLILR